MEKFRPEITFIADNQEPPQEDTEAVLEQKIEQETGVVLNRALDTVAHVFNDVQHVQVAATNSETKQEAEKIKRETSSALTNLYKKIKGTGASLARIFLMVSAAKAGVGYLTQKDLPPAQHLDRKKLPLLLSTFDRFVSTDLVDTYNTCVKFVAKRKNGRMFREEILFKEEIADNILPYGYTDYMGRLKKISPNSFEKSTQKPEKLNISPAREDLFRMYLGLRQKHGTLSISPYSPSQSKNKKTIYYQFDTQKILTSIFSGRQKFNDFEKVEAKTVNRADTSEVPPKFEGKTFANLAGYVRDNQLLPGNYLTTANLGTYKAYIGHDKQTGEDYISYYDTWDIDPPPLKVFFNMDIDQFNFPFEIYGRIYERDFDHFLAAQKS